jgi:hypothetical protein
VVFSVVLGCAGFFGHPEPVLAATITVDAVAESAEEPAGPGTCTLRSAITAANADAPVEGCAAGNGKDIIVFNIAVSGTGTLDVSGWSGLPAITTPMVIDGFSQPGAQANTRHAGNNAVWRIAVNQLAVEGAGSTIRGLWIGGQSVAGQGMQVSGDRHTIQGNLIYGNLARGLIVGGTNHVIGGTDPAARNIISSNDPIGADRDVSAHIGGSAHRVQGNYFGTDPTGASAVGAGDGVGSLLITGAGNLIGGSESGAGNVFVGPGLFHLSIGWWWWYAQENPTMRENRVEGNLIGLLPDGTATGWGILQVQGAPDNVIGGTTPGAGNVIAGTVGIYGAGAVGTRLEGNTIRLAGDQVSHPESGVLLDGTTSVVVGGNSPAARNVIVGGILLHKSQSAASPTSNVIAGNLIGTDASRVDPEGRGVRIADGTGNTIGGLAPGMGNVIRSTSGPGVSLTGGTGNAVLGNSIAESGELGIDIADDGVTANDLGDGDSGPNHRQNFPELTSAVIRDDALHVRGTLSSAAGRTYRLEFFSSTNCDASGYGEGETLLLATDVFTSASGVAAITVSLPPVAVGRAITATATDLVTSDSSEFSRCATVAPVGLVTSADQDSTTEQGGTASIRVALTAAPTADVQVPVRVSDATEATVSPGSLMFTPSNWSVPQIVTVTGLDDTIDDGDIAYSLTLRPADSRDSSYHGLTTPAVPLVNRDDDAGGSMVFAVATLTLAEHTASASVTVTRSGGAAGGVTGVVATSDGSATAVADYVPLVSTLTFGPGEASKTVMVQVVNDALREPDEVFALTLRDPTGGATLGTPSTMSITIVSDDVEPSQPTACDPRPAVVVRTRAENGQLHVRIDVQTTAQLTTNAVASITFTRLENAVPPMAAGLALPVGSPVVLPAGAQTLEFVVRREREHQPMTVHFTVRDVCGDWKTFVGGGAGAF